MDDLKSIIGKVATGASLSRDEAASAFDAVMSGEATPSQMGGLLMALRVRGETVDEITGAVSAMRSKMLTVTAPPDAVDIVDPPVDTASDAVKKLKDSLDRSLTDEQVASYVNKLQNDIGTSINQAAFAQVTGANQ